jgi:hypothetical protein
MLPPPARAFFAHIHNMIPFYETVLNGFAVFSVQTKRYGFTFCFQNHAETTAPTFIVSDKSTLVSGCTLQNQGGF